MDLIKWNNIFVSMASQTATVSTVEIAELNSQREQIVKELYFWARTFEDELDEEGEPTSEGFDTVTDLADRFENHRCVGEDYLNILFHIWQINQEEDSVRITFQ